jgi:hypothetical protein
MTDLVCYSCGKRYYSAASADRLYGPLTCEAEDCGAPLFEALTPATPPPPEQLETTERS